MAKYLKLDVTERIQIKIDGEDILLFNGKDCIGMLVIKEKEKQYDLVDGYVYENLRIFRLFRHEGTGQPYAEGCDLGWC
ncbi:DUF2553 family protein [Bacillus sp. FJAT-47783]|uniref:DUF2553 family protein n=1 Tax=Bacillus sp. FJAT-47783 TaxID=2922712 RepID=UPI001FABDDA3|nr:DUF2553 family protein [Bacillus sp. FJAT-47783]